MVGRRGAIALVLALSFVAPQLATPRQAAAAEYCFGSPFPDGHEQFGSCKFLLPVNLLGTFAGSIMKFFKLPVPGFATAQLSAILKKGQEALLSLYFGMHTLFGVPTIWPLCSFGHPGENRFVGDKFRIDGLMDFPLPWPVIPGLIQVNRYVGPVKSNTDTEGEYLNEAGGNLVDPGAVVGAGVLAPMAKIRVGVMFGVIPLSGTAKINLNGNTLLVEAKTFAFWPQVLEGEIPIDWIRFPGVGPNGYCPWPAANFIRVTMGGLNSWVDWAEIVIESSPPVVLVPGDQTLSFAQPFVALECKTYKLLKALAGIIPGGDVVAEFASSLMPYDVCARGSRMTWSNMINEIEADGIPVKTTDDMVQVPSRFNSDPAGWLMCDQAAGGSWLPDAPLNYYLNGAAKSMGAGTIDVIAHSKGGVDLLHYMKGPFYASAYGNNKLYIRNVATLASPFKGSPLAASFMTGRGAEPMPFGKEGLTGDVDFAANFWNTFWNTFFTTLLRKDHFRDPAKVNIVTYVLDLLMDTACATLTGIAAGTVRMEQNPEVETELTEQMLDQGWGGEDPNWITFGANADSSGDHRLDQTCDGWIPYLLNLAAGGGTRLENCIPGDDITDGVTGQVFAITYQIVGSYYCSAWDETAGSCLIWSEFQHNDAVVSEYSSQLSNDYPHYVLDSFPDAHVTGTTVGSNADHFTLRQERANVTWPMIKGYWGVPSDPKTDYP